MLPELTKLLVFLVSCTYFSASLFHLDIFKTLAFLFCVSNFNVHFTYIFQSLHSATTPSLFFSHLIGLIFQVVSLLIYLSCFFFLSFVLTRTFSTFPITPRSLIVLFQDTSRLNLLNIPFLLSF